MRFTPTERFWSEDLKSWYVPGMSYTVRHPSSRLAKLSEQWLKEGKIREVNGPQAIVQGGDRKLFFRRLLTWL